MINGITKRVRCDGRLLLVILLLHAQLNNEPKKKTEKGNEWFLC
jgi:hypothetical protein